MKNETKTDKATARPWKTTTGENLMGVDHRWIYSDGNFVADLGKVGLNNEEANAELIVQAVNEHAALLAVAEAADRLAVELSGGNASKAVAYRMELKKQLVALATLRAGKDGAK